MATLELIPSHGQRAFNDPYKDEYEKFDAPSDVWDTEVFQNEASAQLKVIFRNSKALSESVASVVHSDGKVGNLRPPLQEVFRDPNVAAWRAQAGNSQVTKQGHEAFVRSLSALIAPFDDPSDLQIKTKVITVTAVSNSPDTFETRVLYEASGRINGNRQQQNATWNIRWSRTDPPSITQLVSESHEETATVGKHNTLFADITEAVLGKDPSWKNHLSHGVDHWRRQLERTVAPGITANAGLALGDLNGDGLDEVFLCRPLSLPNRVLIHLADGTVRDIAPKVGLDSLDPTSSALTLDLDNDGDQDLITGGDGGGAIYEKQGQSHIRFARTNSVLIGGRLDGRC